MKNFLIAFVFALVLATHVTPAPVSAYGGGIPSLIGFINTAATQQGQVLGASTTAPFLKTPAQIEQERIIAYIQQRIVEIRAILQTFLASR